MEAITADDANVHSVIYLISKCLKLFFFLDIFSGNFELWDVLVSEHSECV